MADLTDKVINRKYRDKLVSITDFRRNYAQGITLQAVTYAVKKDLIDHVDIAPKVKAIVLTSKTLAYKPNKFKNRRSVMKTEK